MPLPARCERPRLARSVPEPPLLGARCAPRPRCSPRSAPGLPRIGSPRGPRGSRNLSPCGSWLPSPVGIPPPGHSQRQPRLVPTLLSRAGGSGGSRSSPGDTGQGRGARGSSRLAGASWAASLRFVGRKEQGRFHRLSSLRNGPIRAQLLVGMLQTRQQRPALIPG